jgi:S-DNA-T family DNA segregation ATPase FtsK/SpoIIIE
MDSIDERPVASEVRLKKRTSPKKSSPSILPDVCGILLVAFTFIVLFSLLSYTPLDNSLQVHGEKITQNWIGPGGALFADVLFTVFGVLAFVLPLLAMAWGIACFWRRRFLKSTLRVSGAIVGFLSASILLEEITMGRPLLSFPLGGLLGRVLNDLFVTYVSTLGTAIIASASFALGLVMMTRLPFGNAVIALAGLPAKMAPALLAPFKKLPSLWPFSRSKTRIDEDIDEPSEFLTKSIVSAPSDLGDDDEEDFKRPFGLGFKLGKKSVVSVTPEADSVQIIERDVSEGKRAVELAEREKVQKVSQFELPPLKLLDYDAPEPIPIDERVMRAQAERLEKTFAQFGIVGQVREIRPGPVVTMFEFVPAPGIKLSRIAALADDIAMAMTAVHVRIVAPIPGKGAVGIEIPNDRRETVFLKEIVAHAAYHKEPHKLCMALGKTVEGKPYFLNLADMPHVLISGTTGSGKSVSVNAMICSILYRATPDDVRFIMIDPKMLELSIYDGIPHLLLPPIIDSKKAAFALKWAVKEMDRRYFVMNDLGVRDIYGYNEKIEGAKKTSLGYLRNNNDGKEHEKLPFIVIVVDEYADLVAVAGKDVEGYVMRLAQKARACGIHVMLATQRPSVDVITGVIKANFPVRMGFRLAAAHDSKTIINRSGAEKLLGKGDMLMIPPGTSDLVRVHGAFISEKELVRVIDFWKTQAKPTYDMSIVAPTADDTLRGEGSDDDSDEDDKYQEAIGIVMRTRKCSTSWLQRQLGVGYNRAARMVEQMEREGIVGPILNAKGDREIFGQDA